MTADAYENERNLCAAVFAGGTLAYHEASAAGVEAADFKDAELRAGFSAYAEIITAGGVLTVDSVAAALEGKLPTQGISARSFAAYMAESDVDPDNAGYYARLVAEAGRLRRLRWATTKIAANADAWEGTAQEFIDEIQRELLTLSTHPAEKPSALADLIPGFWQELKADYESRRQLLGLPTGIPALNRITQGFQGGDVIVIKALTGVGKSVLASNFGVAAAKEAGAHVDIYSLEMRQKQILKRMVFAESLVASSAYFQRTLCAEDWQKLRDAHERLRTYPIRLFDDSAITLSQIGANCRRAKMAGELDMVIVDYAQLITPPTARKEATREREVAEISRTLKVLANELNVPFLVVSQVNDDGKERESRAISHDASIRLHLESLEAAGNIRTEEESKDRRPFKLTVEKNRDGATGFLRLVFMPEYTLFAEAAPQEFGAF